MARPLSRTDRAVVCACMDGGTAARIPRTRIAPALTVRLLLNKCINFASYWNEASLYQANGCFGQPFAAKAAVQWSRVNQGSVDVVLEAEAELDVGAVKL